MDDLTAAYNRALAKAKVQALKVLQELLQKCDDPAEARRIAAVIFEATQQRTSPRAPRAQQEPSPQPPPKPIRKATPPAPPPGLELDIAPLHLDPFNPVAPAQSDITLAPIQLTPAGMITIGGGPHGQRPLPPPLGPSLA